MEDKRPYMRAIRLKTDDMREPLGIGDTSPVFSWNAEGGIRQTAYILKAERDGQIIFDTGKVVSGAMRARYAGKPLKSRDRIAWTVRLFDENGLEGEESSSGFEMGLLSPSDWEASWIKGDYRADGKKRYPVDCFKKEFRIEDVRDARLYASAKGVYDVSINGIRIEDFILAPGITDYRNRIQYQTYDVTGLLKEGMNVMEIRLADGWFRGSSAAYGVTNVYGKETSVIAQLEAGGKAIVRTDGSFLWSDDGPIRFADLKDGERADMRIAPSYKGHAVICGGEKVLSASDNVYVKEKEVFKVKLVKREVNRYVFDTGQNMAGYISFRIPGMDGARVVFTCAETLGEDGDIDMKGIQLPKPSKGWSSLSLIKTLLGKPPVKDIVMTPLQRTECILKDGINEYKTSFAVFGFRYIEAVSDVPIDESMINAVAVYSDMEETGSFISSNDTLNRFFENVRWSMKSNFLDIPTDCPTRERLGWTGDAQIFFNTASYLMDVRPFFKKWLRDMSDAQYENGVIPAVLPYEGVEMMYKSTGTSVGWADAVYLIPYYFYKKYGDEEVLRESWPMIEKYLGYLLKNLGARDRKMAKELGPLNGFVYEKGVHLGEWLEPEEFRDTVYGTAARHMEECTAYLFLAMKTIGEIAGILSKNDVKEKCASVMEGAKKAYEKLFLKEGTIDTKRQAKLVRPLALGILDGEERRNVENRLNEAVKDYGYCVGTGFLSTPYILPVLEGAGYSDTAYRMLLNEKAPGWLSEVKAGATTVWENWEGDLSLNHYSPGAAAEWLFTSVLGINTGKDGRIVLKPVFSCRLDYAKGSYRGAFGEIKAGWIRNGTEYTYEVELPPNTIGEIVLNGRAEEIGPGRHSFVCTEDGSEG